MDARGGKADQHIAGHDIGARQDPAPLHRTDGEAGEVVVLPRIHAGHLRRLAADERTAGLAAAVGDAGNDRSRGLHIELAAGEIVEEEQRLGALGEQVVDAHGDEIDADGGMQAGVDGNLELGADAVVGGNEDRVLEAGGLEIEQRAEAAEIGVRARPPRRPDKPTKAPPRRHRCQHRNAVEIGRCRASWHGSLEGPSQLSPYRSRGVCGHSRPGRESVGPGLAVVDAAGAGKGGDGRQRKPERARAGEAAAQPVAAALTLAAGVRWGNGRAHGHCVFTVANYPVEARADNAAAAKDRALADGQQAAFRSLLKRLVPVTAYARIKRLANVRAGDLVDGFRVRSERNSSTDYIASLDFTFQSKGVRDLLRREGIPFTDEQAPALTIVPVWRAGAAGSGKGEAAWTNAWKGLDLEHALTPVKLQALKKEVAPATVEALAGGDGGAIRTLVAAYGSELVLLAVAEHDAATNRLNVTLSGRDAVGAFVLRRAYRVDAADPGYANDLAAVISLGILEGRWKAIKSRSGGSGGGGVAGVAAGETDLLIAVEFRGMSEWQDISRKLGATPGVEELEVAGLSARGARVTLRFAEGAERLADALAQQGLSLRNADGNWVLKAQ